MGNICSRQQAEGGAPPPPPPSGLGPGNEAPPPGSGPGPAGQAPQYGYGPGPSFESMAETAAEAVLEGWIPLGGFQDMHGRPTVKVEPDPIAFKQRLMTSTLVTGLGSLEDFGRAELVADGMIAAGIPGREGTVLEAQNSQQAGKIEGVEGYWVPWEVLYKQPAGYALPQPGYDPEAVVEGWIRLGGFQDMHGRPTVKVEPNPNAFKQRLMTSTLGKGMGALGNTFGDTWRADMVADGMIAAGVPGREGRVLEVHNAQQAGKIEGVEGYWLPWEVLYKQPA